jgi:hypothetical protein
MKTKILLLASLLCGAISFTGCASNPGSSNVPSALEVLGPPIATVASERLSLALLKNHPGREGVLSAVSADLGLLTTGANIAEITDAAIKSFVESRAEKWGLLAGESDLLIAGLQATRAQFMASTGATTVLLSDPRVVVYISAVRSGIATGIAENARRSAQPTSAK